ncbi:MAG: hypothetical protein OEZ13_02420 [Spirochaetia bacterium]|nr:hypothetical protein [Spirochaetia bacterium]
MTEYPKKCPECGAKINPLPEKNKRKIVVSILIGAFAGLLVGFWFVTWWFQGLRWDLMTIVHLISGAVLGALVGWGAGAYSSKK